MNKISAIIVDIDGTLANAGHRLHHIRKSPKDWPAFFAEAKNDEPFKWCQEVIQKFAATHQVIFLTGRGEEERENTLSWLYEHAGLYENSNTGLALYDRFLLMRPAGCRDHDYDVKRRIYRETIEPHYDVLMVLEDRGSVVKMWRELGLICLQCSDWEEKDAETAKEAAAHFGRKPPESEL